MKDYLDNNGVRYLWTKIKQYVSSAISNKQNKISGTADQIVGFDSQGNMVAKNKENLSDSFSVSLLSSGWSGNSQTIMNNKFNNVGFSYFVSPESSSYLKYVSSSVRARDVTVNGQIIFDCSEIPDENLTINITRLVSNE